MFSENAKGINIEIMGKQHKFTCSVEQAEDLKQAANNLAEMCDDIQQQKGNVSSERALLVAAINLSYSLLIANNTMENHLNEQNALISTLKQAL